MNIPAANNEDNEVQKSSAVETSSAGLALLADAAVGADSFANVGMGRSTPGRRRLRRRRNGGGVWHRDPNKYCRHCGTKRTPMWRKGPKGPMTLCNACGINYMKQVNSRGSEIPADGDASTSVVPADDDNASTSAVPAETVEADSKGHSDI